MIEIKGFEDYLITRSGEVISKKAGRALKPDGNSNGYLRVSLCKNGKVKRYLVHRLVASHYIPNPEMCKQVNHKDACKSNNVDTNLEWCTPSENIRHAIEVGVKKIGEDHAKSTLSNETVKTICEMISQGFKRGKIMNETGATKHQIDDIRRRKTWGHISKDYIW